MNNATNKLIKDLRDQLQFVYDNVHKWTGSSGPGAAQFAEDARNVLAAANKHLLSTASDHSPLTKR